MNRDQVLDFLVSETEKWGQSLGGCDWTFIDGQYVHTLHDPITIDDWNRAKIKPDTKIHILSEEHNKYVLYLAKCLGFDCGYGEPSFGFMCFLNDMTISYYNDEKHFIEDDGQEIFIEMPKTQEQIYYEETSGGFKVADVKMEDVRINNEPVKPKDEELEWVKLGEPRVVEFDAEFSAPQEQENNNEYTVIGEFPFSTVELDLTDPKNIKAKVPEAKYEKYHIDTNISHLISSDEEAPTNIKAKVLAEKVGRKYDQGKPRYDLIPVHAEAEFVDVLTFGATKYGAENWRKVEDAKSRYQAALGRHIAAYRMGETHDIESGKHHLAHAMCCLSFIIELDLEDNQ